MLKSNQFTLGQNGERFLTCCNTKNHTEMLLHQDYEMLHFSKDRNDSKHATTDSFISDKQSLSKKPFKETALKPKISLSQRRRNSEMDGEVKKQRQRPSNFYLQEDHFCLQLNPHTGNGLKGQKKENILSYELNFDLEPKKNKTSLKHRKRISANQPILVLSTLDNKAIYCPQADNQLPSKYSKKMQTSSTLLHRENTYPQAKGFNLKLGQNLPTFRSQFNNTHENVTERSYLS